MNGPEVVLLDSLVLDPPGDGVWGHGVYATPVGHGEFAVSDGERYRVTVYDSAGHVRRTLLVRRAGPDNHQETSAPFVLPRGEALAVHDWGQRVLLIFDAATGRQTGQVPADLFRAGPGFASRSDTLFLAVTGSQGPLARWAVGTESVSVLGSSPPKLRGRVDIWLTYGGTAIAPVGPGWVVALGSEPGLRLLDGAGAERRRVAIPAARRRGTPPDLFERAAATRTTQWFQPLGSRLEGIGPWPGGGVVVAYSDFDQILPDSLSNRDGTLGRFRYFASIVAPGLGRACVDGQIPADSTRGATLRFHGDTVDVLSLPRPGPSGSRLTIRRYRIRTTSCDWLAMTQWPG